MHVYNATIHMRMAHVANARDDDVMMVVSFNSNEIKFNSRRKKNRSKIRD